MELSNLLLAEGNTGGAVHHLEAALAIDPEYGVARHNLRQIQSSVASRAAAAAAAKGSGSSSATAPPAASTPSPEDDFDPKSLDATVRDALRVVGEAEVAGRKGEVEEALRRYEVSLPIVAAAPNKHPKLVEGLAAAYWNQVQGATKGRGGAWMRSCRGGALVRFV